MKKIILVLLFFLGLYPYIQDKEIVIGAMSVSAAGYGNEEYRPVVVTGTIPNPYGVYGNGNGGWTGWGGGGTGGSGGFGGGNPLPPPNPTTTYYRDADGDGWGNSNVLQELSAPQSGWVTQGGDHNDNCYNLDNDPGQCSPSCGPSSPISIDWSLTEYVSQNLQGISYVTIKPFSIEYSACADVANNVWRLRVAEIKGGVKIVVNTGGFRDVYKGQHPISQTEARDAIYYMKGYYSRGYADKWQTEGATRAHEEHHYREWQCASFYFWPFMQQNLEQITVPLHGYQNGIDAKTALMVKGKDKVDEFQQNVINLYQISPSDAPMGAAYAAGQLELNKAILYVQDMAKGTFWDVPQGITPVNYVKPCP